MRLSLALLTTLALAPIAVSSADEQPAAGKFLVATSDVDGSSFERTVILLLHYDEAGAQGLVINRRSDAEIAALFADNDALSGYAGTLYWGGPVRVATLRALLRTDEPPADAVNVVADVYQVPVDVALENYASDDARLRFYVGYAGWAPGQLDRELRFGSWDVVAARADAVFAPDPDSVWHTLRPVPEFRVERRPAAPAAMRRRAMSR